MEDKNQVEELKKRVAELEGRLGKEYEKQDKEEELGPIYSWNSPDRILVERSAFWYSVVSGVAVVSIGIALILGNLFFVVLIICFVFLVYVLNTTPPTIVTHTITSRGVKTGGEHCKWEDLQSFVVIKKNGEYLFVLEKRDMAGRLSLIGGSGELNKIFDELIKNVDYGNNSFLERWFGKAFEGDYLKLEDVKQEFSNQNTHVHVE